MIDRSIAKDGLEARARSRAPDRAGRQPARVMGSVAQGRAQVHALRPLQACDADRVRRRARSTPRSCSSASSRGIRRISPASPSSVLPARFSTRALEKAGIDRSTRLRHQRGQAFQVRSARQAAHPLQARRRRDRACRWWIEQERELIRPPVTVALGATAARSLIGKIVTIGKVRGKPLSLDDGSECWVTVHPSSLLRMPDPEARHEARALFVRDLKLIKRRAEELTR